MVHTCQHADYALWLYFTLLWNLWRDFTEPRQGSPIGRRPSPMQTWKKGQMARTAFKEIFWTLLKFCNLNHNKSKGSLTYIHHYWVEWRNSLLVYFPKRKRKKGFYRNMSQLKFMCFLGRFCPIKMPFVHFFENFFLVCPNGTQLNSYNKNSFWFLLSLNQVTFYQTRADTALTHGHWILFNAYCWYKLLHRLGNIFVPVYCYYFHHRPPRP